MKSRSPPVTAMLCAAIFLFPAASGMHVVMDSPPPEPLLDGALGLRGEIHGPNYAYAGHPFTVVAELSMEAAGVTIAQVLPVTATGPCVLSDFHVTGGIPLGSNYYLLISDAGLTPVVDPHDPPERFDGLDIHTTWDTAQDLTGTCEPSIKFAEVVTQALPSVHETLGLLISVVELPATPIALGTATTTGGNDVPDGATVVPETTNPPAQIPIIVLIPNPQVSLQGVIVHKEVGPTVKDDGYFEIRENGGEVADMLLTKDGDAKHLIAVRDLPHKKGETVETEYCLYGVYKDGGLWVDWEGPAEGCIIVAATEPDDPTMEQLLQEACLLFSSPAAKAGLEEFPIALVPRTAKQTSVGALATPGVGPAGYFMYDRAFGERCD